MDPVTSLIILVVFLAGLLLMIFFFSSTSVHSKIRSVKPPRWDLKTFLRLKDNRPSPREGFLFSEENVTSMAHRYNGRFDQAILRWDEVPILEMMIERKFPVHILPTKAKQEDIFQASLYTLALLERGISCSSTKLVVIYCLQKNAEKCFDKASVANCFKCRKGKTFQKKFNAEKTIKLLDKMNQVWYKARKPKATPSIAKCSTCPYKKMNVCNYSAV
ncbi:MAG: hypothetical protein ACTSV2_10100 [Candidatus Thorarchaeota archaeon]